MSPEIPTSIVPGGQGRLPRTVGALTMPEHLDPTVLETYLTRTRWFAGKGRALRVTGAERIGVVPGGVEDGPTVVLHLVEVTYDDAPAGAGDRVETYQVPLSCYTDPERRLDHAFIGWWQEPGLGWVHAYDALHDKQAMACWLRSFVASRQHAVGDPDTGLTFHRLPGHELDPDATATLFTGEQSNSSVRFGEDAVLKVFRKITPGANPDIEVHEVLTRAGSDQVARLYGWVGLETDQGVPLHLAMLQEYLTTATDGFDLALSSVRNLFAEGDLHAHEVGGDFAGESSRLGVTLAEVHEALRTSFPTPTLPSAEIAAGMTARLDAALPVVPELAAHAEVLRTLYQRLSALGDLEAQRVHGDLHLGQTLRTASGWRVVDFEGEPAKALAERVLPDSRWRDVAGMLRSFDYAPHVVERTIDEADPQVASQHAVRAQEWAHRNRNHFLTAYAGGDLTADQRTLLAAYTADKAVYECVYETRNRPTWVAIPLDAVARIGENL